MLKFKLMLLSFLLLVAAPIFANPCVVVATEDGETELYLSEEPTITFNGRKVILTTSTQSFELTPQSISDIRFEDRDPNSIENATGSIKRRAYIVTDNGVTLNGCLPGESVAVYSANGAMIGVAKASGNGQATISTTKMPAGVYIIKAKSSTIKIIRK